MKEMADKAHFWEKKRDHASEQFPNFHFSEGLFQIAIVLCSVAIIASLRAVLGMAVALGAAALVLMLNGFFLFY